MQDREYHDMMASAYSAQSMNNARHNDSVISCRLQGNQAPRLRRYCEEHGVSVNALLNELVNRFLHSVER